MACKNRRRTCKASNLRNCRVEIWQASSNITIAQNARADLLFELVHVFDLVIGDDPSSNSFNDSQTHNHAVYGKRQI